MHLLFFNNVFHIQTIIFLIKPHVIILEIYNIWFCLMKLEMITECPVQSSELSERQKQDQKMTGRGLGRGRGRRPATGTEEEQLPSQTPIHNIFEHAFLLASLLDGIGIGYTAGLVLMDAQKI